MHLISQPLPGKIVQVKAGQRPIKVFHVEADGSHRVVGSRNLVAGREPFT